MRQIVSAKSSIMTAKKTIEQLAEQKVIIVGSPDTVLKQLRDCHKQLGFSNYVAMLHFGSMSHDIAEKNIRRFAFDRYPDCSIHTVHQRASCIAQAYWLVGGKLDFTAKQVDFHDVFRWCGSR